MSINVSVKTRIKSGIENVWEKWTKAEHIVNWNFATPEWHCPKASNTMEVGAKFSWRMEAKDGSMGFDYEGTYTKIEIFRSIELNLDDGRKVRVLFKEEDGYVEVEEIFEVEDENSVEMQKAGWQAILDNYKSYVENS